MHRTRIKICGVTRPQDAVAAASAGADAIGMVFHPPSPRNVTVDRAKAIVAQAPTFVSCVGLFVDSPLEPIKSAVDQLHLSAVQLHGDEPPELVARLQPIRVIKALRVDDRLADRLEFWKWAIGRLELNNLVGLVMETGGTAVPGGSGVANDWAKLAEVIAAGHFGGLPALIAAGGLTPENVEQVVKTIRPWAVDVSSGVEAELGEKSDEKLRAFMAAVANADGK